MWKVKADTPKRLPTWVGGNAVSPYAVTPEAMSLDGYTAQPYFLQSISFLQVVKFPFLVGFKFVDLGLNGYNNSQTRNVSLDLNSCYFLNPSPIFSRVATVDFYFTDLNFYTDLDWLEYYTNPNIFIDTSITSYKKSDLKGIAITPDTVVKIRLEVDIFTTFLGLKPLIKQKELYRFVEKEIDDKLVGYGGKVYKADRLLNFDRYTYFVTAGDTYLCH